LALLAIAIPAAAQPPCNGEWRFGPGQGELGVNGAIFASTAWDADGPGPAPAVLIVGGNFSGAGHAIAPNLAAWVGPSWQSLGAGSNGFVSAVAVFGGAVIAGGIFPSAGGQPAARVARWNGVSWQPMGSGISSGQVMALADCNGQLVAGGQFS